MKRKINQIGWEAVLQLGKQAEDAGIQDMTLDEVNAIIKDVREKDSDKGGASEMAQAATDKF